MVSLRLSNNELGSKEHIQLIRNLLKYHKSLTSIDLSNDESNHLKNKLGNAGLEAVIDGIMSSEDSTISMINLAQNNICLGTNNPELCSQLSSFLIKKCH